MNELIKLFNWVKDRMFKRTEQEEKPSVIYEVSDTATPLVTYTYLCFAGNDQVNVTDSLWKVKRIKATSATVGTVTTVTTEFAYAVNKTYTHAVTNATIVAAYTYVYLKD